MIRVEAMVASPRKKGNSSVLVNRLMDRLDRQKAAGESIFLFNEDISPCTDCRACKTGDLVCTVRDAMQPLYQRMEQADVLIFATPVYWFGPTASLKKVIERLRPYYLSKRLAGKKLVLILPAGNGIEDCDLIISMMKRIADALELEIFRIITPKAYDAGEVLNDGSVLAEIDDLATAISNL